MTLEDMLNARFTEYDGIQFQKLFYEIMRVKYNTDFEMPWPYGNVGDYKCDGYYKPDGAFYACYAPENPSVDTNASEMIKKINSDIEGLKLQIKVGKWKCPFLKFVFVVNMKNKKTCPSPLLVRKYEIESELESYYGRKIEVSIITQYDLKIIFNSLEKNEQEFILNKVFIYDNEFEFDGAIISKIIEHFSTKVVRQVKIHNIMEFEEKIKFNNLNQDRGDALEYASFNIAALENYFEELGNSSEETLQTALVSLYNDAKKEYPDNQNLQFDYIKDNLYQISEGDSSIIKKKVTDSTLIIMSKYFENCSIFESEEHKNESDM